MHALISKGELVSDETIIAILKKRLQHGDIGDGYIMDGFPRTKHQAEVLSGMSVDEEVVLYMKVGKPDVIVKRLVARLTCPHCDAIYNLENNPPRVEGKCDMCNGDLRQRSDDNEDTVLRRLNIYRRETKPVIEYYRKKGVLTVIDATANIDDVYKQIANVLKGEVN
jgi:adenylate kinase